MLDLLRYPIMLGPSMHLWTTDAVPERESFAFWNDAVCEAFLRVRTERAERSSFRGSITSSPFDVLGINHVKSGKHRVRRTGHNISLDSNAFFFVNLHRQGSCVLAQAGRAQLVTGGDVYLFDSARPFDLDFSENMALASFIVPREALIARTVEATDAVARVLPSDGAGALFRNFAASLPSVAETVAPSTRAQIGNMFIDLLALTIGATQDARDAARPSVRRALFLSVCARIKARLPDSMLDLAAAAASAGMAPRTLQTLFHENGTTFSRFLLEQRLNLADRQLRDLAPKASITQIAYAVGFSDLSYFNRAFRRLFGMTPSERRSFETIEGRRP